MSVWVCVSVSWFSLPSTVSQPKLWHHVTRSDQAEDELPSYFQVFDQSCASCKYRVLIFLFLFLSLFYFIFSLSLWTVVIGCTVCSGLGLPSSAGSRQKRPFRHAELALFILKPPFLLCPRAVFSEVGSEHPGCCRTAWLEHDNSAGCCPLPHIRRSVRPVASGRAACDLMRLMWPAGAGAHTAASVTVASLWSWCHWPSQSHKKRLKIHI